MSALAPGIGALRAVHFAMGLPPTVLTYWTRTGERRYVASTDRWELIASAGGVRLAAGPVDWLTQLVAYAVLLRQIGITHEHGMIDVVGPEHLVLPPGAPTPERLSPDGRRLLGRERRTPRRTP